MKVLIFFLIWNLAFSQEEDELEDIEEISEMAISNPQFYPPQNSPCISNEANSLVIICEYDATDNYQCKGI